jgi:hypothetical protein
METNEPLPEFHDSLLRQGGAEMTAFAGKGQEIFMATIFAFDAGEAVVQAAGGIFLKMRRSLAEGAPVKAEIFLQFEELKTPTDPEGTLNYNRLRLCAEIRT